MSIVKRLFEENKSEGFTIEEVSIKLNITQPESFIAVLELKREGKLRQVVKTFYWNE